MRVLHDIRLPFDHTPADFDEALRRAGLPAGVAHVVLKKSLDARRKGRLGVVYSVGLPEAGDETRPPFEFPAAPAPETRPVIVGAGPAGLFIAWRLLLSGVRAVLLEQGAPMRERMRAMALFMRRGTLDPRTNICFGAGGAGAWSDGKLFTRIRSPHIPFVMETFVRFGAAPEVRREANPHLGSNRIRRVIAALIDHLAAAGVNTCFHARAAEIETRGGRLRAVVTDRGERIETDALFLAAGHSARAVYAEMARVGAPLAFKPFAVGVRVEHPRALITRIQYGDLAGHPGLDPARYHLTHASRAGGEPPRACYTFCMCPGGYLLNAATEPGGVTTNGMSNRLKNSPWSNAGVVVSVGEDDCPGNDPARGLRFQADLERAFAALVNPPGSSHALPGSRLTDFLDDRPPASPPPTSCPNPVRPARLGPCLPPFVFETLRRAFHRFGRRMRGFITAEAAVVAVESRTSAPVRILRADDTLQSPAVVGLYPVGEGAGYAGGITSAACDGVRAAEQYLSTLARR
ncbi:MAG: hypothetical protein HY719_17275 [Planctomycetes bacterium]|nr:hypothetical protein [Planctomycetota bacterium]